MAVTIEDMRAWGRIDEGEERDAQMALMSAVATFAKAGVTSAMADDPDYIMGVCMLAVYRYDNRAAAASGAMNAIPYGVRDIMLQLRYDPRNKAAQKTEV